MNSKNNFLYASLSFFIAVITFLLLILTVPFVFPSYIFSQPIYFLIVGIMTLLSIGLGSFIYLILSKTKLRDLIGTTDIKHKKDYRYNVILEQVVLAGLLAIFTYPIVVFIQYIWQIFTNAIGMVPVDTPMPDINNIGAFLLAILGIAIIPGIFEELLFRGVLQRNILNNKKPITAILITSALFMLMHGDVFSIPYTFVLGALMGYLSYRSSSILPAICYHIVNNIIAVCALWISGIFPDEVIQNAEAANISQDLLSFIYIGAVALICCAISYFIIRQFNIITKKTKKPEIIHINIASKIPIAVSAFFLLALMGLTTLMAFGFSV